MTDYPYKRILLKISGESLGGSSQNFCESVHGDTLNKSSPEENPKKINSIYCRESVKNLAHQIVQLSQEKVQIALVVGGGNILRGGQITDDFSIDRSTADTMGMLATVINALAFQGMLESLGASCRVLSGIAMPSVTEPFIRRRAIRHLEKGRIVIFAAGTGNPFFTTDTAAALRALEIHADVMLKATNVPGVFSDDPKIHADAVLYEDLSYQEAIEKNLKVMDGAAFALLRDFKLPLIVFSMQTAGHLQQVLKNKRNCTFIHS